ncbi:hypothetical protein [Vibrio nigripulchritudo]|uniref:hypothetical protein n=1 Tax=Vibrio nigripulchritudo TaxID=28173 RepID=UPI0005F9CF2F|nr:hypothetical protein [Vibrio nigripulchritudo]KJY76830.1 hypothetical protein TW74_13530 [Vibrio nigripulchritudo]
MKIDFWGKIYIGIMSIYFIFSGFNALWDIDSKLERIGLSAVDSDGEIAFILIYCSLMIGIGVSIALLYYFSNTWIHSALVATVIITSFIVFRLVGSYLTGTFSSTQITFLLTEMIEVSIGLFLLYKSNRFCK